ncbi:protein-L-isoaspartate O-methyltransferase family protein [Limimaricola pyoseonensis]|uniref:Protein-L-isoaspartate O-methyltransferase n=1 Tax=Limimaricola pyoseonensis TaxID=521013 RepID=A0A1G7DFG9_9RHOB|nr:protein-L-isoaspartate O-methyltransferase [Limimaricola pyoseonensis]SDE50267.1 protein-L-isoaspartate(D-aspartate) O-methyltransferase [Limimaricola pyoseonensis]
MVDYATRRVFMVDTQVRPSDVTKFPIINAMLEVPREQYVPAHLREAAYVGENLPLGGDRVVLEPRTLAKMLDGLMLDAEDAVLDLGCGLGYSTAVLARLAGFVAAVEDDEARAAEAQSILTENGVDNAAVLCGPLAEGAAKSAPYDAIILQGAIERFPESLEEQLREGGRVAAIFAEGAVGVVRIGHKIDGRISWRYAFNAGAPVLAGFEGERDFVL